MCGTDWTIGADTALNIIVKAIDSVMSTAASHQREFVIETMGRNCGWLGNNSYFINFSIALNSAISTGSDYVLIPENPIQDWKNQMTDTIKRVQNYLYSYLS
jgi:6-phosphofructokinase 1